MSMLCRRLWQVFLCLAIAVSTACGGGGGGGNNAPAPVNQIPVAAGGPDQTVFRGTTVQLDGSASSDPDGNTLSYSWQQIAGPQVQLSDANTARPTFAAPRISGSLSFSMTINDGHGGSAIDAVTVNIQNRVPTAAAGPDRTSAPGEQVTLAGSTSVDPDGDTLTFVWIQVAGPAVDLTPLPNGDAIFAAPSLPSVLQFALQVSDGELASNEDTVTVSVGGASVSAPFADAGGDQTAARRSTVTLLGWAYDPMGLILTGEWRQVSGPSVQLSDPSSPYPSFTAPETPATLEFELVVSNGLLSSLPDRVLVEVRNFAPEVVVTLTPDDAYTLDDLSATVSLSDADMDSLTVEYSWRRNGTLVPGLTTTTYPNAQQAKGDVIEFVVTASDSFETTVLASSKTILDTPAVVTASPPAEVAYGDTFSFSLVATDIDNDPADQFRLRYGPAGMTVSSNGVVTWPAELPMFETTLAVNYGIELVGQQQVALAGTVRVRDDARAPVMRRTGYEIPARDGALKIADLDNDGNNEVLIAAYDLVYELGRNGTDYVQRWAYPGYLDGSNGITVDVANVAGDARPEIFIGAGQRILRLDGPSRTIGAELTFDGTEVCSKLEIADVDVNGSPDLVCLVGTSDYYGAGSVVVIDPVTMQIAWRTVEFGGSNVRIAGLAIGNVDADAALEIVTGPGYVFDGASHLSEWAYGPGFGFTVDVGDVDGNGIEEIVGVQDWTAARVFNAVAKSPVWDIAVSDTDALLVRNIDGGAAAEILLGDGQWGEVTAYRYDTTASAAVEMFAINSQGDGVTTMDFGDVDGDGMMEFVWGTDATSSGPDSVVVAGRNPAINVEWINDAPKQINGTFVGGQLARVAPGQQRFMFGTARTDNGYAGARLIALDPATGLLSLSPELGTNWAGALALDVVDYDADGVEEVFLSTAALYDGYFSVYDFTGAAEEWRSPADTGTAQSVTHGDLNADGVPELVTIGAGSGGTRINVFDVKNSTLIWRSVAMTGSAADIIVADLAGDGVPELVAATTDRVVMFQKTGPATFLEIASVAIPATDLVVADTDGVDGPEIYVLSSAYSSAMVTRLSRTFTTLNSYSVGSAVNGIGLEDLPGGRRNLVVFTAQDYYSQPAMLPQLRAIDAATGDEVWTSPLLAEGVSRSSLFYSDPDADGRWQISFAAGSSAYLTR